MKKLIFVMLFLSPSFLSAQCNIAVNSGVSISTLRQNSKIRKRLHSYSAVFYALSSHFSICDKWNACASLQYNDKGFDAGHNVWVVKQNSLDLLAELEYEILPSIRIGPGFYFSEKLTELWNRDGRGWEAPFNNSDLLNPFDMGVSLKLEMRYKKLASFIRISSSVRDVTERFHVAFIEENRAPDIQLYQMAQFGLSYSVIGN